MLDNTSQTLTQGEHRAITITVLDQDNTAVIPTSASTFKVTNSDGTEVLTEANATISDNTMTGIITTAVTGTVGRYYLIWKIYDSDGYLYYHKTLLQVVSLISK
jgi:hypothetical protein